MDVDAIMAVDDTDDDLDTCVNLRPGQLHAFLGVDATQNPNTVTLALTLTLTHFCKP